MSVITVSQLNNYMKRFVDSNVHLSKLWVKGEISNYKKHYTGHIYMTLKDETSVVKAVMFKGSASSLMFEPDNGMKVIACGKVAVFERDGQYQLYVESMVPDGVGELHIAYEQLKEKLEQKGYFDEAHKKPIPKFPSSIGVITSPTGAAIRDILNVLTRRYPVANIYIYPAQVQGVGASATVADGIKMFNSLKNVDVIIAGRGGGSIEDLWAFNEENVADAIYNSDIPIISAVGHETDFTIADFVADLRAPTPSAGAELAVPDLLEVKNKLATTKSRLSVLLTNAYKFKRKELDNIMSRKVFETPEYIIEDKKIHLDNLTEKMLGLYQNKIDKSKNNLLGCTTKLETLNPMSVLNRGYTMASKGNAQIKSIKDLSKDDKIKLKFIDGTALCLVTDITEE